MGWDFAVLSNSGTFWEGGGPYCLAISRDDLFAACSYVAQLPFQTRRDLIVRAASRRLDEPDIYKAKRSNRSTG